MVAESGSGRAGQPEHPRGRPRRRRLRPARLLRVRPRHPDLRPPRRGRSPVRQLPHDGPVLAHPGLPPDRPQPPLGRHGPHRRAGHRLPGLRRPHPAVVRHAPGRARSGRVRRLGGREVAPHARGRAPRGGVPGPLAARTWLRALLRVLRGRDAPVRPGPGVRQPPRRAARRARRGLSPDRGPRGPRHPPPARSALGRPREALLLLPGPGRLPLAAPDAAGVDRALPRPVRGGLGRLAGGHLRPPEGARRDPGAHGALRATVVGPGLGRPQRRRTAALRPLHGGLRRLPHPRRPPRGPGRRPPRGHR